MDDSCRDRSANAVSARSNSGCSPALIQTLVSAATDRRRCVAIGPRPNESSPRWSTLLAEGPVWRREQRCASCWNGGSRSLKRGGRRRRSVRPDRYLHPHLGSRIVADLTSADIDDLYVCLRRSGGIGGKQLQSGTLARIHVVLRSSLGQAMRWGWIWDNPAERAHRIAAAPKEMCPPTPAELRSLLDFVADRDPLLHVFLLTAAVTGARRAQLLGLRWRNIDIERARISFCRGWVEGPDGPVSPSTKTKRPHTVDIDPASFAVLENLHRSLEVPPTPDTYLFTVTAESLRGSRTG